MKIENSNLTSSRFLSNNIKEPDWNIVPHKGMQTLANDEMKKQIAELAKKELETTTDGERKEIQYQIAKLRAQYISAVSPDRKTLLHTARNKVNESGRDKPIRKVKTLVEILSEENGMKNGVPYPIGGNGSVKATANTTGGYDYQITYGTETVLHIDTTRGLTLYVETKAEGKLREEFSQILRGAGFAGSPQFPPY